MSAPREAGQRWLNLYRDWNGTFHCSELGFETEQAARQVGIEHGDAYLKTVQVEWVDVKNTKIG
jgi:hypothetical protein